jgi:hypothetical protein
LGICLSNGLFSGDKGLGYQPIIFLHVVHLQGL